MTQVKVAFAAAVYLTISLLNTEGVFMSKLAVMIFIIVAPTLAGIAMVAGLVLGFTAAKGIIVAVVIGTIAAIPASFFIAKAIGKLA